LKKRCSPFDIRGVRVIHRVGVLEPGAQIVLVAVTSAHSGLKVSKACEFLMDYLKTQAPFWKKEHDPKVPIGSTPAPVTMPHWRAGASRRPTPEPPRSGFRRHKRRTGLVLETAGQLLQQLHKLRLLRGRQRPHQPLVGLFGRLLRLLKRRFASG
jgi:hypothetical protein